MLYQGATSGLLGLPQQNTGMILLQADRFQRAAAALSQWAEPAKKCVEYFEGKQWSATDLAILNAQKRPALTLNKIKPLVNLVLGYHLNNRTDIRYMPGNDGSGTSEIADALTHVGKQISEQSQLPYIDGEVYLDGVLTGRGYFDCRLSFENNDLGDCVWTALDPFSQYMDPDGESYDINEHNFTTTSRMISIDEVEHFYGIEAANLVRPLTAGMTYQSMPSSLYATMPEITPWRRFGGEDESVNYNWAAVGQQFYDWIDRARKSIRLVDTQHWVRCERWFFVDLETGDKTAVPDNWDQAKVTKVLTWAVEQGQPLELLKRKTKRVRWTHMVGDIIVYDEWSPYATFTVVPFFPYFRRGQTRGMIEDLLGPQDEINKRRSSRLNTINRTSNGGWMFAKGTLDAQQKANLELYGSTPGVQIEYDTQGGKLDKPEPLAPGQDNVGQQVLEKEAEADLKEISGINESALGQLDRVQSGVAIQARQQQAVLGLEGFMSNYKRSKELGGRKQLEIVQQFYTEERTIRVIGNGNTPTNVIINHKSAAAIANNVTLGRYAVMIDDQPLSKSFLEGQFEELLRMKGDLAMPIPDDFIIDASSLGRKEELKVMLREARLAQQQADAMAAATGAKPPGSGAGPKGNGGAAPPPQGPGPGGSRVDQNGGSMPPGEPGAPPMQGAA